MFDANHLPFSSSATESSAPPRKLMGAAAVAADYTGTEGPDLIWGASGVIDALGGNDNVLGSTGNDTIYGGAGDDSINGNGGDDALYGGDDNDTIIGGSGIDTISGDGGNDSLRGSGNDSIDGGTGNDTLTGYLDDTVDGGDGNDKLVLNGASEVRGGAGDDAIYTAAGGAAIAHVAGGEGRDTYHLAANAGVITIEDFVAGAGGDRINLEALLAATPQYVGGNPFELSLSQAFFRFSGEYLMWDADGPMGAAAVALVRFVGLDLSTLTKDNFFSSAFPNGIWPDGRPDGVLLTGTAGNDSLTGGVGFDTLVGGAGIDTLVGGKGDDHYEINVAQDVVRELADGGLDTVDVAFTAAGSYKLAPNVENATVTAAASVAVNLEGNELDNLLTGNAAANALIGGAGNDTLDGGLGNDTLTGGAGNDRYVVNAVGDVVVEAANGGSDGVATSLASYTLGENVESLSYLGSGAFAGRGNAANNSLNAGNSTGALLDGGAGNDAFFGSNGNDTLLGGDGDDGFSATIGSDVIDGGAGNDTIFLLGSLDSYTISRASPTTLVLTSIASGDTLTVSNIETMYFAGSPKTPAQLLSTVLSAFNDNYTGTSGDDTIDGLAGVDTLAGGDGNDNYVLDVAGDQVVELAGGGVSDTVQVAFAAGGSYTLGANVENLVALGTPAFNLTGNALDNFISGSYSSGGILDGKAGNDHLVGGYGNDSLVGGLGDDTMSVGLGADTVDGGDGEDIVFLEKDFGSYTVTRTSPTETILTDAEGNLLTLRNVEKIYYLDDFKTIDELQQGVAISGPDYHLGTDGNDKLTSNVGVDTMAGGLGNDTYVVNNAADVVVEDVEAGTDLVEVALTAAATYTLSGNVENATVTTAAVAINLTGNSLANALTGNAAANTLDGGAGNDSLDGGAGNDTLIGGDGADSLIGGAGADKLVGGDGDDNYVVDNAGDVVVELAAGGRDGVQTTLASYTLGANVESVSYKGGGAFTGTGNELDNYLLGGDGGAKLDGGAGNDSMTGGLGNDSIQGGLGNDMIISGTGKDTVDGGAGVDTLMLAQSFDSFTVKRLSDTDTQLTDSAGNVVVLRNVESVRFAGSSRTMSEIWGNTATPLNDSIVGTGGDDVLDGAAGADTLTGGAGNDTYVVDNLGDTVLELADSGHDLVQVKPTAAGTYVLAENVEDATVTAAASVAANLTGNGLDNVLTGNAAANTLLGGAGNDTLIGGAGSDKLGGGAGNDEYLVTDAGDVVTELAGEGIDTIVTTVATQALAANVENLVYTGAAAFTGTGNALDNIITGGNAGNKLDGGAGNDQLRGGSGADSLQGGLGNDTFIGAAGKDTIDGGADNDVLQGLGNFDSYTITRPNATDTVLTDAGGNVLTVRNVENFVFADGPLTLAQLQENIASIGGDNLHGTDGDDLLNGGFGADTLAGGLGDDTYVVEIAGDVVNENAAEGTDHVNVAFTAAGTYVMTANVENATVTAATAIAVNLTGNALANKLTGNAAANTLLGGAGNDTLDGGAGADKLSGGSGDDTYLVDVAGDVVTELVGEGTDTVKTALASYTLTANVENLAYTGAAAFTGTGNALDNIIIGGNAGNKLDGGAGNDQLTGGGGADSLQGGLGNDTFVITAGKDTIDGGADSDVLQGLGDFGDYTVSRPNGTDTVLTDAGGSVLTVRNVELFHFADGDKTLDEVIYNIVSNGNDKLYGDTGNDVLNGLAGADILTGGEGNDTYVVDNAGDVIVELADQGTDLAQVAFAAAGTYTLGANVENATVTAAAAIAANLTGNALANKLTGNAAANTLIGGGGDDTLDGGAGADKLSGGEGDDVYVVDVAADTVTELAGQGVDSVSTTLAAYALGANLENLYHVGAGAFTGTGNALDNDLYGGNGGAKLDGGAGNDTLEGGLGNDSLQGGAGDDIIYASTGTDTIDGGAGTDSVLDLLAYSGYTVVRANATDVVLINDAGHATTVRNVENFVFDGVAMTLDEVLQNSGGVGSDTLTGTAGDDVLDGGPGVDRLVGGAGDDIYILSDAGDVVIEVAAEGNDTIKLAAAGTYVMAANVERAEVIAAAGIAVNVTGNGLHNQIIGNAAANKLSGGAGDDTLAGGAGNDTLVGGTGSDSYVVEQTGDVVTELAGEGTDTVQTTLASYTLGANVENLWYSGIGAFTGTGNALNNEIDGSFSSSAVIDGGAGNDIIHGSQFKNALQGGVGDDTFLFASSTDVTGTVDGGAGDDQLRLEFDFSQYAITSSGGATTFTLKGPGTALTVRNVETVYFNDVPMTLAQVLDGIATDGSDTLIGGSGVDVLDGGLGADRLIGGAGNDMYILSEAGDVVVEEAAQGIDSVQLAFKAAATYTLAANVEKAEVTAAATVAVNIVGNELNNTLIGNAAANKLTGGAGNDSLDGGAGNDVLTGGTGNDTYWVTETGDTVVELTGEGVDLVVAYTTSHVLAANVENLVHVGAAAFTGTGNAANNLIVGDAGNDLLKGMAGNDTLIGGAGNDQLTGGADADVFVLNSLSGSDTITDFVSGTDLLKVLLPVGNGDSAIDGGLVRAGAGGFATDAELVLFTQKMATASTANAAAVIGSATGNYAIGDTALFAVPTATATVLYRFQASNADALVSAGELTQLVTLTGTPNSVLADYSLADYLG